MTKTDFIDANPVLISKMMVIGQLCFLDSKELLFKGLHWYIERNLSYDELSLIQEFNLVVGEVARVDDGLVVWVMYEADLKELNKPPTRRP